MTGFVRVLGNLGVLLFWIVLAANLMAREWVDADSFAAKAACVGGVMLGIVLLAMLRNGLNLLGVSPYFFQILLGVVILASAAMTGLKTRRSRLITV